MDHDHPNSSGPHYVSWAFWLFAAIGAYYLITEHRTHLFDYLPYVLLMACPLMHVFGHGHGEHRHHTDHEERKPS